LCWQTTNKRTPLKTCTSLCYAMPVGNKNGFCFWSVTSLWHHRMYGMARQGGRWNVVMNEYGAARWKPASLILINCGKSSTTYSAVVVNLWAPLLTLKYSTSFFAQKVALLMHRLRCSPMRHLVSPFGSSDRWRLMTSSVLFGNSLTRRQLLIPFQHHVLKQTADVVAPFVTELFNRSLSTGHFLAAFKEAFITPIVKKPGLDATSASSCRPISNLSVLSKLLERLVIRQL